MIMIDTFYNKPSEGVYILNNKMFFKYNFWPTFMGINDFKDDYLVMNVINLPSHLWPKWFFIFNLLIWTI